MGLYRLHMQKQENRTLRSQVLSLALHQAMSYRSNPELGPGLT